MFPVKEFENRFRAILNALDERSDGSESFEELNAEFEDALCILEEINLRESDWQDEFTDALDDFEDLSARYRTFECAHAEADSIDRLVALARLNLPKGVIGLS